MDGGKQGGKEVGEGEPDAGRAPSMFYGGGPAASQYQSETNEVLKEWDGIMFYIIIQEIYVEG